MSYCILFFGISTVLRAFLAFIKSGGFGPFSQIYERFHTVLGFVDSFEGISGIYQNWWIWSFLSVLWAIVFCFGVRWRFQGPVWHLPNLWIWSFIAVLWAIAYCFVVSRQFRGHFWQPWKLVDLVLSCSFMTYSILFWDASTLSRAFLAFIKTRGFDPFSQFYELLYIVFVSVDSFEANSGIYQN